MKKLNYYQVHKNKKPKLIIKYKKYSSSTYRIRAYFKALDKMTPVLNKVMARLIESFNKIMDKSPKK